MKSEKKKSFTFIVINKIYRTGIDTLPIIILSILLGLLLPISGNAEILKTGNHGGNQIKWQDIKTVEDLWETYPEIMRQLFTSLDYKTDRLKPVEVALNSADTVAAGYALIEYYRNAETAEWLRNMNYDEFGKEDRNLANQILNDAYSKEGVTGEIPILDHGGWDWTYTGPENDAEFGYNINRHRFVLPLLRGWYVTDNSKYAEKFDQIIRDWIIHNPLPDEDDLIWEVHRINNSTELDWRDIGEVVWRDLDTGIRLGESWLEAFFGFQEADSFSPAARIMMLHSIIIQADYLQNYHKNSHNWTTMEMNGLGLAGISFPEIKKSDEWASYALEVMEKEINGQVYPDGVQLEISTKTQWVALSRFELLVENFRRVGRKVSEGYLDQIEKMYNYIAYSMRPDGHQPLNNDSDREDVRERILKAAETYDRSDWIYIATNGEKGTKPEGLATTVFPWGGMHIMRNNWTKMGHWGFFHTGPYGIGHQHRDLLHLSIHAYGRDLIVDGGRFTHENYFSFDPSVWRGYFRGSFSHNVILVDGAGQNAGPFYVDKQLKEGVDYVNTQEFDYAKDTFSSGFMDVDGDIDHTRAVMYVKDKYWVVVDHVATDRSRMIETLWHYAPDVNAVIEENQILSDDAGMGNLRIVPAGNVNWDVEIIKGQTEPYYQGWYSETYGKKEPNPTAIYSTRIESDTVFAWVLVPADGLVPSVKAEIIDQHLGKVKVHVDGQEPIVVTVPVIDGTPSIK